MRGCLEHIVIVIYNLCRIKDYNTRTMMLMTRVLRGNNTLMNFTLFHFLYILKCMTRIFTFIPFHTSSGLILIHYTLFLPVKDENSEGIFFVYGPQKLIQFRSLLRVSISLGVNGAATATYTHPSLSQIFTCTSCKDTSISNKFNFIAIWNRKSITRIRMREDQMAICVGLDSLRPSSIDSHSINISTFPPTAPTNKWIIHEV